MKRHQIRGNQRLILNAKTAEPFFLSVQRKVARAQHDVRLRLRQETYYLKADGTDRKGARQGKNHWPRDRWEIAGERDDTDTGAIASDPQLVQFAAFRDEPAVENFEPKLSGIHLTLNDQTTKSDESSRISFRCQRQIPNLQDGSGSGIWRTAATTTSNPASIVLDLMTGDMPGTVAIPDAQIDFPSFYAAYLYYNTTVPAQGGGTEVLHRCDFVLDRAEGGETLWQEILSSFRSRLIKLDGKYQIVVDKERTAPRNAFGETEILEMESDRSWLLPIDALSVEFFNAAKGGDLDEIVVYADSQPVAALLPNGGYAEKTAAIASAATSITRSGNYATLTLSGGPTWAEFPGEVIGVSGKTGTVGGHYGAHGYPHLHLSLYAGQTAEYARTPGGALPVGGTFVDPLALYAGRSLDSHVLRALPEAQKRVIIPYKTANGRLVPPETRFVWPYLCQPG